MSERQAYPPTSFYDRLTELSKLKDGWLDGQGKAPTWQVIKAASVIGVALPGDIAPRVYPTEAGGISLEWEDVHGSHQMEVLPDERLFLMSIDQAERDEAASLRREVEAARKYAADMRDFASPHGVSVHYADTLVEVMDRAKARAA